ncbi:uncharacterized protein LOC111612385 [Centruroides sculpturatus]|uniref:uncharacterized protein LOC111612385 n=1 Tax=Centruroides sculpturatus TaxID=218467 RepID=UPI000C6E7841|nr:uncharacterized protein LOC111612385 [Centruroides sculpturatus]
MFHIKKLLREDLYKDIEYTFGIGLAAMNDILHNHLHIRKIVSWWVPHSLIKQQKETHVEWCHYMMENFQQGTSKCVGHSLVTRPGYQYDSESNTQLTVWVFSDVAPPVKVKCLRIVGQKMVAVFFGRQVMLSP